MVTPAEASEITRTLARLEENYRAAAVAAGSASTILAGSSPATWLYVSRRSIDYLAGPMRSEVTAGARTYAAWKELAATTNATLQQQLGTLPGLTFAAVLSGAAADFKADAADVAAAAVPIVGGLGVLVALALGAYVVFGLRGLRAA